MGTLKAETSTRMQNAECRMEAATTEAAAAFPACKAGPLISLSARIEEPTRYVGGRSSFTYNASQLPPATASGTGTGTGTGTGIGSETGHCRLGVAADVRAAVAVADRMRLRSAR